MRHILKLKILFFFWLLCCTIIAQQNIEYRIDQIDSLEQVLASIKNDDLQKCNLLLALYDLCRKSRDFEKSENYANQALQMAQKKGWQLEEGRALVALGNLYMGKEQYYSVHVNYKKAEKIFLKINEKDRLYDLYHNLMILFTFIYDDENVAHYAEKVLKEAIEREDKSIEIIAHYFLVHSRNHSDEQEMIDDYINVFQKALPLEDAYTNHIALNCGRLFINLNRPREALYYLHWVRVYYEKRNFHSSDLFSNLAKAYAILQENDSAEHYLRKSIVDGNLPTLTKLKVFFTQSFIEANKKNYKNSLELFKKYHKLNDSLNQAQTSSEISRMKNWHEFEQKDRENELLQFGKEKRKKLIWFLSGSLIMILAMFAIALFLYRKTVEKNRELNNLHTVKDKLFSVISHDVRSPLSSLLATLKLANRDLIDHQTQTLLLEDISKQVDDTNRLIENLLCWSTNQMQGINFVPIHFDILHIIQATLDGLSHIANNKNVKIINNIKNQQVFADPDMFSIIVRNLTMNAIKYSSAQGEILLNSEKSENNLIISIKDSGTGMSQEIQNNLFKLTTTKSQPGTNNEKGTGLGLVLSSEFVKKNGGEIWFTSKEGEGTTFFFSVKMSV